MISNDRKNHDRRSITARRKIASFAQRFGQPHLYLAYYAAFPLALTPDLLYRLWANFQQDTNSKLLDLPWVAVSDILLSSLCQEVGQELYEMDEEVRDELLKQLQSDENFGQQRIQELSDFLLEYVQKQLQSNDLDVRDFAQAQQWTVLAYTKPGKAAREMALAFQQLGLDATNSGQLDKAELVRMAALVKTFTEPLAAAGLEPLLVYAHGMDSWARGKIQQAAAQLAEVTEEGKIQIAGLDLPIPEAVQNHSAQSPLPVGKDYSNQNLRGRSFKGQDLRGANFSNADIRSADFTKANLMGAKFNQAKTGLERRWASAVVLFSLLLLILTGMMATLVGLLAGAGLYLAIDNLPLRNDSIIPTLAGSIGLILFLILCITTLSGSLRSTWNAGALAFFGALLFAASLFFPLAMVWGWSGDNKSNISYLIISVTALVSALALTRALTNRFVSRWMALVGLATTLVLVAAFLMGKSSAATALIVALVLIATVMALGLIWIGNRVKRLSRIFGIVGILALLVALLTGVILIVIQAPVVQFSWLFPLTAMVALIVAIPLMLSGGISLSGASIGSLIVPAAITIFFSSWWADPSSTLISAIAIAECSVLTAITAWTTIITIAVVINLIWAEAGSKIIAIGWTLLGTTPLIFGTVLMTLFTIPWLPALHWKLWPFLTSVAAETILATSILLLGTYIGWRSLAGEKKFTAVQNLAVTFIAKGGTSFRGANLTDANFTEAILKNADFTDANLTGIKWFHAQKLYLACIGNSYLQFPQVQQLVITGIGQYQNFNDLNLQGINLQQMHLANASFSGTNLTEANLRQTNLSGVQLVNTQLDKADLFGACLTGAYIQDVKITSGTQLRGVECKCIFTRKSTQKDPDRIPEDYRQIFKPGEFVNFMHKFDQYSGSDSSVM
jgi:uncharacterized protein YjbI with pentapeptide repeats